jgi:hypothetical protein
MQFESRKVTKRRNQENVRRKVAIRREVNKPFSLWLQPRGPVCEKDNRHSADEGWIQCKCEQRWMKYAPVTNQANLHVTKAYNKTTQNYAALLPCTLTWHSSNSLPEYQIKILDLDTLCRNILSTEFKDFASGLSRCNQDTVVKQCCVPTPTSRKSS